MKSWANLFLVASGSSLYQTVWASSESVCAFNCCMFGRASWDMIKQRERVGAHLEVPAGALTHFYFSLLTSWICTVSWNVKCFQSANCLTAEEQRLSHTGFTVTPHGRTAGDEWELCVPLWVCPRLAFSHPWGVLIKVAPSVVLLRRSSKKTPFHFLVFKIRKHHVVSRHELHLFISLLSVMTFAQLPTVNKSRWWEMSVLSFRRPPLLYCCFFVVFFHTVWMRFFSLSLFF